MDDAETWATRSLLLRFFALHPQSHLSADSPSPSRQCDNGNDICVFEWDNPGNDSVNAQCPLGFGPSSIETTPQDSSQEAEVIGCDGSDNTALDRSNASSATITLIYFPNFFCRSISLSSILLIFPEIVFGKLATNSTSRGYL